MNCNDHTQKLHYLSLRHMHIYGQFLGSNPNSMEYSNTSIWWNSADSTFNSCYVRVLHVNVTVYIDVLQYGLSELRISTVRKRTVTQRIYYTFISTFPWWYFKCWLLSSKFHCITNEYSHMYQIIHNRTVLYCYNSARKIVRT